MSTSPIFPFFLDLFITTYFVPKLLGTNDESTESENRWCLDVIQVFYEQSDGARVTWKSNWRPKAEEAPEPLVTPVGLTSSILFAVSFPLHSLNLEYLSLCQCLSLFSGCTFFYLDNSRKLGWLLPDSIDSGVHFALNCAADHQLPTGPLSLDFCCLVQQQFVFL
jgi:hypothetical protein